MSADKEEVTTLAVAVDAVPVASDASAAMMDPTIVMLMQQNMMLQQQVSMIMAQQQQRLMVESIKGSNAGAPAQDQGMTRAEAEEIAERKVREERQAQACAECILCLICCPLCCFIDVVTCNVFECTSNAKF
jgi:hypothetical protein